MKPNLERLDKLIAAAQAWREFQYLDSIQDQRSDVRLRGEAEYARQALLTEIDALENVASDSAGPAPATVMREGATPLKFTDERAPDMYVKVGTYIADSAACAHVWKHEDGTTFRCLRCKETAQGPLWPAGNWAEPPDSAADA
jgi:hypothetical protein